MKKLFLNSAIVLSSFFGVFSCSEDSEPQVQEVDIEDANAISGAIEISKAIRLEGTPPAPTTVAGTPGISSDIEAVTGSEGNRVVVPFSLDSGDVQKVCTFK